MTSPAKEWRECRHCTKKLPMSEFQVVSGRWHRHTCRVCRGAVGQKYYQSHKEKFYVIGKRSREKHPDRFKARTIVRNLISSGKLKRKPCEVCQKPSADAHHTDYSKPLLITWLCSTHHGKKHRKLENRV
jgi:hypothetical protein